MRARLIVVLTAGVVALAFSLFCILSQARANRRPSNLAAPPADLGASDDCTAPSYKASAFLDAAPVDSPTGPTSTSELEPVLRVAWGDGPKQIGHKLPEEGAPEGPMSFSVDESGRIWILDQVNQRVQIFDRQGEPGSVNLPADTYQDMALNPDGDLVVIDRLAGRKVETYGPDGKLLASVDLEGGAVFEGGAVTGLFTNESGTWVEVEHRALVQVSDAAGRATPERQVLPGRFSADGVSLLTAMKTGTHSAAVLARPLSDPQRAPQLVAQVHFSAPLVFLTALESDSLGRVVLAGLTAEPGSDPGQGLANARQELWVLAPGGQVDRHVLLAAATGPEEIFRPLRLGPDGNLYILRCDEHGVSIRSAA
jgi:hypothetical protein